MHIFQLSTSLALYGLLLTSKVNGTQLENKSKRSSKPWRIAMYTEKDCEGDYYVLSGRNMDFNDKCLYFHGNAISSSPTADPYCRWYTNEGFDSTTCEVGTLKTPASWKFDDAICQIYTTTDCSNPDDNAQTYTSAGGDGGCMNYDDEAHPVSPWGSVMCAGTSGY